MLGISMLVFVMFVGGIYLGAAWSEHEFDMKSGLKRVE